MSDNTEEKKKNKVCAVCKSVASKVCGRCRIVYYCNREHQKADWKIHSMNCQAYELVEDSTVGRFYVATRKIEVDEIVLCENKPLISIPAVLGPPRCLNCYIPLTITNGKPCDHCGWLLCLRCKKHGPECELTIKYRKSKIKIESYSASDPYYHAVVVLRALALKQTNPKAYGKLLSLEHHCKILPPAKEVMPPIQAAVLVKNLMKIEDVDKEEIAKIIGIGRVNAFGVLTSQMDYHSAVFDKASYVMHDCLPNCRAHCYNDSDNEGRIVVRAATTIPKGHPITITYTDPFRGTIQRRHILRKTKFFDCTCERCKDPTEFGTMFNAVKCTQGECTGYMLPPTFLVSSEEQIPDFVCDKCNGTTSSKVIDRMMKEIFEKFSQIPSNNVIQLKKFIENHLKILHENHYHIFKAEYTLAMAMGPQNPDLMFASQYFFEENIKLCKKLLILFNKIIPGETTTIGRILFNEYTHMRKLADRKLERNPSEARKLFAECKQLLKEVYRLLRYEPKETQDGQIAEWAALNI